MDVVENVLYYHDLSMSSTDVFEDEIEASDIHENTTLLHSNVSEIFKLEE